MTKEAAQLEGAAGIEDRIEEGLGVQLGQMKISEGNHGPKSVSLLLPNSKSTNNIVSVDVEQYVGDLRLSDEEPAAEVNYPFFKLLFIEIFSRVQMTMPFPFPLHPLSELHY